jgi:hypothetical protein
MSMTLRRGGDRAGAEQPGAILHGSPDRRGAVDDMARRCIEHRGEGVRIHAAGNQGPWNGQDLVALVGPLDVRDDDAPGLAAGDGALDLGPAEGRGKALHLQPELVCVDAPGAVHGQHQSEIDVDRLGGGARHRRPRQRPRPARRRQVR